jgi:hypothetical protein
VAIIGIVGSRSRDSDDDYHTVTVAFLRVYNEGDWICSGGCPKGGDRFAKMIHKQGDIPYLEFPADWQTNGRGAGMSRNTDIAKNSDVLIACVSQNRMGGTEDTIKKFIKFHGKENLIIV